MADEINVRALCVYKQFMDAEFVNVSRVEYYIEDTTSDEVYTDGNVIPKYIGGYDPKTYEGPRIYGEEAINYLSNAFFSGTLYLANGSSIYRVISLKSVSVYNNVLKRNDVIGASFYVMASDGVVYDCFVPVDIATYHPLVTVKDDSNK